mmetsp:Transcript_21154/g.33815  ORF Transcript_21154/g.33815 Transcript_21154/m.33815 type:complete len:229 (+) Transcript_21154:279-965(+)
MSSARSFWSSDSSRSSADFVSASSCAVAASFVLSSSINVLFSLTTASSFSFSAFNLFLSVASLSPREILAASCFFSASISALRSPIPLASVSFVSLSCFFRSSILLSLPTIICVFSTLVSSFSFCDCAIPPWSFLSRLSWSALLLLNCSSSLLCFSNCSRSVASFWFSAYSTFKPGICIKTSCSNALSSTCISCTFFSICWSCTMSASTILPQSSMVASVKLEHFTSL